MSTARVLWDAASLQRIRLVLGVPVGGPLPHVADHVGDIVAVRWKCPDRRGALVAVGGEILMREITLPGVGHLPATRCQLATPGKWSAIEPTTGGKLPLGLGWQLFARPLRVSLCVAIS